MTDARLVTAETLAAALDDLFPVAQRDRWPFTSEQAAAAILAFIPPDPRLDALLADGQRWQDAEAEGHIVTFSDTGYGLMHPPSCRPDLIGCEYNVWLAEQDGPAREPGRYRMTFGDDAIAAFEEPGVSSKDEAHGRVGGSRGGPRIYP
jgi:hypothetical protein